MNLNDAHQGGDELRLLTCIAVPYAIEIQLMRVIAIERVFERKPSAREGRVVRAAAYLMNESRSWSVVRSPWSVVHEVRLCT